MSTLVPRVVSVVDDIIHEHLVWSSSARERITLPTWLSVFTSVATMRSQSPQWFQMNAWEVSSDADRSLVRLTMAHAGCDASRQQLCITQCIGSSLTPVPCQIRHYIFVTHDG